jgi:hypothetical protein
MSVSNTTHQFWMKLLIVSISILGMHAAVIPFADGGISVGLPKVSGEPCQNMIIGTSRVAQTLMPSILESELGVPFHNFAFDAGATPYCDAYFHAITKKLDRETKNGLFILSMDPFGFTAFRDSITGATIYPQEKASIGKQITFNGTKNIEYLIRDYHKGWGQMVWTKYLYPSNVVAQPDGWVDVVCPIDSITINKRKQSRIRTKKKELKDAYISHEQKMAFRQLVSWLQQRGKVYLVRLPVDPEYYAMEESWYPDFKNFADSIQMEFQIPYFNMQDEYSFVTFNDGHHINRKDAPWMTKKVAHSIAPRR